MSLSSVLIQRATKSNRSILGLSIALSDLSLVTSMCHLYIYNISFWVVGGEPLVLHIENSAKFAQYKEYYGCIITWHLVVHKGTPCNWKRKCIITH